jgi:hypothetical protein
MEKEGSSQHHSNAICFLGPSLSQFLHRTNGKIPKVRTSPKSDTNDEIGDTQPRSHIFYDRLLSPSKTPLRAGIRYTTELYNFSMVGYANGVGFGGRESPEVR